MKMAQLEEDLKHTYQKLTEEEREKLKGAGIVLTGAAGFLGYYLTHFLYAYRRELEIQSVLCLDNYLLGTPKWLQAMEPAFQVRKFDVVSDEIGDIPEAVGADYVIHMASIASPTFYRKYPIQTVDANVWGLRRLLDYYREKDLKGFLFFSSSEIYGDPEPSAIPTPEDYRGSVSCTGPRACYDEAKRFGETLCALFAQEYGLPVGVVRPFNNYGPGIRLNDRRVPADFARSVAEGRDLVILSDGGPSRTFCHIADAAAGYLKALIYGRYDYFNIGIEDPEITVGELAQFYLEKGQELFGYEGKIRYEVSSDRQYLTDNPKRRCPNIDKARRELGYDPDIRVEEGIGRFLAFIKESQEGELIW